VSSLERIQITVVDWKRIKVIRNMLIGGVVSSVNWRLKQLRSDRIKRTSERESSLRPRRDLAEILRTTRKEVALRSRFSLSRFVWVVARTFLEVFGSIAAHDTFQIKVTDRTKQKHPSAIKKPKNFLLSGENLLASS
jgi:hypothetical protein